MKHAELIERLEAAEVGSRELDVGLAWLLEKSTKLREGHANKVYAVKIGDRWVSLPHYTTSLDAARALHGRVLPKHWWLIRSVDGGGFYANVGPLGHEPNMGGICFPTDSAKTPELAWCIAILRALDSQSNTA